ncbi:RDD family protein [Trinickia sp.]|uniref:RDD family protein n=1 Tax=Trinickia sp. TaxID=2571163 RepID=UPI003F7CF8BE
MVQETNSETVTVPRADHIQTAGFWRRTAAFAIDGVVLGLIGMAVIALGFEWLARIGAWGRLIGFALDSLYFVLMEGTNGRFQSFGKQALKIKVVRITPDGFIPLSASQAWVRYAIVAVPFVLGGVGFVDVPIMRNLASWPAIANSEAVFVWGVAIVYLVIFNRPSRRSLHDLVVSSAVVRVEAYSCRQGPVRSIHWFVMGLICMLVTVGGLLVRHRVQEAFAGLWGIQQAVASVPDVRQSSVSSMHRVGSTTSPDTSLIVTAVVGTPALQTQAGVLEIARAAFTAMPSPTNGEVTVVVVRGVDLGIATWRVQTAESRPGGEWLARLKAHRRS